MTQLPPALTVRRGGQGGATPLLSWTAWGVHMDRWRMRERQQRGTTGHARGDGDYSTGEFDGCSEGTQTRVVRERQGGCQGGCDVASMR
eukprot:789260-Pyramimonas_sp.AAC.1